MRRALLGWCLFGGVWIALQALTSTLVERRIALTQAAFWTAALVPLVQAAAVESLAQPFGLRAIAGSWWREATTAIRLVWAASLASAIAVTGPLFGAPAFIANAGVAAAGALAMLVPTLFLAGRRELSGLLAVVVGVSGVLAIVPGAIRSSTRIFPGWPQSRALLLWLAIAAALALVTLFRAARAAAPELAATYFEGAAGATAVAAVAAAIPVVLGVPLDPDRMAPSRLLAVVAVGLVVSGALAATPRAPRRAS